MSFNELGSGSERRQGYGQGPISGQDAGQEAVKQIGEELNRFQVNVSTRTSSYSLFISYFIRVIALYSSPLTPYSLPNRSLNALLTANSFLVYLESSFLAFTPIMFPLSSPKLTLPHIILISPTHTLPIFMAFPSSFPSFLAT